MGVPSLGKERLVASSGVGWEREEGGGLGTPFLIPDGGGEGVVRPPSPLLGCHFGYPGGNCLRVGGLVPSFPPGRWGASCGLHPVGSPDSRERAPANLQGAGDLVPTSPPPTGTVGCTFRKAL